MYGTRTFPLVVQSEPVHRWDEDGFPRIVLQAIAREAVIPLQLVLVGAAVPVWLLGAESDYDGLCTVDGVHYTIPQPARSSAAFRVALGGDVEHVIASLFVAEVPK